MKVLVTDGDYKNTLGIVRSLGRQGHTVSVLARRKGELAACSKYCSKVEITPQLTFETFADVVLRVLERTQHDLLIPVGYLSTFAAASSGDKLRRRTHLDVADADKIALAADKRRVRELALSLGLKAPRSFYPRSIEEARRLAATLEYPVVLKPASESLPKGVRLVATQSEFMRNFEQLKATWPASSNELPMIQSFVPGYGCGFFALYQNGQCKRVFMHRRIREFPASGGASCCAESFYDPALQAAGMTLLDALKWHGVAMVEFRYNPATKEYLLLEVNPKFWGSLDLALAAGADFPGDLCKMAGGADIPYAQDYTYPLRFHWPLSGDIQHFFERPAAFVSIAGDFVNPSVRSNIWLDDWRPQAREFAGLLGSLRRMALHG